MTTWYPDTCDCVADLEKEILLKKCKLHKTFTETISHNRSYNLSLPAQFDKEDIDNLMIIKETEKKRIGKL